MCCLKFKEKKKLIKETKKKKDGGRNPHPQSNVLVTHVYSLFFFKPILTPTNSYLMTFP